MVFHEEQGAGPFVNVVPDETPELAIELTRFAAVSRAYTVLAFLPVLAGVFPACEAAVAAGGTSIMARAGVAPTAPIAYRIFLLTALPFL